MKNPGERISDQVSPRQQRNWDWRAASNFIAGGAGGGLLLFVPIAGLGQDAARAAILLGLGLIGAGLTCVWFEIGRPWRALNVYRHFTTSWMTREAVAALLVFAAGGWALLTVRPLLIAVTAMLGLTFLYSQARILAANKGIPAWRHPRSVSLMVATGLTEGAGFLACVLTVTSSGADVRLLAGLIALIVIRSFVWKMYLGGLTEDGAPVGAVKALRDIDPKFMLFGHILPVLAIVAVLAGMPGRAGLIFVAGILAVAGGWSMKYALVRRAAFTQGLALLHLPARGRGPAGPAAKPGWKPVTGTGAG